MKKGFTLVELSIVLVIIGLLIGGVLVAQSMIETAKIQSQVRQIQQFDAAVANFITTYNGIPGDSPVLLTSAEALLVDGTGGGQGANSKDGYILDTGGNLPIAGGCCWGHFFNPNNEVSYFWVELGRAGFMQNSNVTFSPTVLASGFDISSNTPNSPKAAIESNTGVIAISTNSYYSGDTRTVYQFGNYSAVTPTNSDVNAVAIPSITPEQAQALDTKMDDGLPQSGMMQPIGYPGNVGLGHGNSTAGCLSGLKYSISAPNCGISIVIMSQAGGMPGRATQN